MLRGFLAAKWVDAIEASGSNHPERRMATLQRLIWAEWVEPIWKTRNDILHGGTNQTNREENDRLAERMLWYMNHKEEVLTHHDQFLARFDMITVNKLRRKTKREWVRQLDVARLAYEREKHQKGLGQSTLHRYFGVVAPSTDPSAEAVT